MLFAPTLIIMGAMLSAPVEVGLTRYEYEEPHMGTRFRLVCYAPDQATADRAAKAAFARVAELNDIMSDYVATSELSRLCQANTEKPGQAVPVSEDLFVVLSAAQELSRRSDGAFDVTVRPLVQLWRDARRTQKLPPKEELADALELVGYEKMTLDADAQTVTLQIPGMQLDLGGIAKGYAADEALEVFEQHGIRRALVAAGGDIRVGDSPPDRDGWRVEIAPLSKDTPKRVLQLTNAAVSTSGDLEQFVEIDGIRYSHIIDPKTGVGLTERKMATIIAPKGITADSMTKVLSVLPVKKGIALIEDTKDVVGQIVRRTEDGDEEIVATEGFEAYLVNGE